MIKPKVLVFSDCYIYGGSEKLMSFLLKNNLLNKEFELLYSYRTHREYRKGLNNEGLNNRVNNYPLFLFSNNTVFHQIDCLKSPKIIKRIFKIPFFILDKLKIYFLWNFFNFLFLLIKTKPNIIHVNNGGYPGAVTCNLIILVNFLTLKTKVIYQINNQAKKQKHYFDKVYDNFINKNVNYFINASFSAKQQLIEKRNFNSNKILIVNNCSPLLKIKESRAEILNDLKLPLDCFLILEVAFLTERKGQKYLIEALFDLYNKNKLSKEKVFCAFIGNGENETFLRNQIDQLNLSSNVFLLGYKNNTEDYISACDLFILPSIKDEDMPLVLLSALGYGKPIITTDLAGIKQVIISGENGVLIETEIQTFSDNIANAIYNLYEDEILRNKIASIAKDTYVNYSPEKYGFKIKEIYEKVNVK